MGDNLIIKENLKKLTKHYGNKSDDKNEKLLEQGNQNIIDLISYSGLEERNDHLIIDGQYKKYLFISGYPFSATSGWLNNLVNFNYDLDISYHIEEVESSIALPKLNRKITELESSRRIMARNGQIIGPEITDPLNSAKDLRDKITRGQEKLFQLSVCIGISANTLVELNNITKIIESLLSSRLFFIKTAMFRQIEGINSILPRAQDKLNQKRNLDSSSTALTFPFMSSELVQEDGILYGINKSNNSLVILDRFSLNNANSIMFAESGSGKSYTTKVEILRQLLKGTDVIVIDPEREYEQLAKSVDGSYIKLSVKSKQKINPFDLNTTQHSKDNLSEHAQDLLEVISLMSGGLTQRECAAVDKAILNIYKQQNLEQPLLEDFYAELNSLGQLKLCERLEKYISGTLSNVFNSQTNINLNNNLIVFDIKDMPESLRQLSMMIISIYIQNRVKNIPKKRLLVIDEGWILLQHEQSARFITGLVRRARKYYLGVAIISQAANDFLNNDYGRAIASQSSLRILMRQDTTTIRRVTDEFILSEYEQNYLLTCGRGEALIIADQNHVALKVVASKKEHPLITTNPIELYQ